MTALEALDDMTSLVDHLLSQGVTGYWQKKWPEQAQNAIWRLGRARRAAVDARADRPSHNPFGIAEPGRTQ